MVALYYQGNIFSLGKIGISITFNICNIFFQVTASCNSIPRPPVFPCILVYKLYQKFYAFFILSSTYTFTFSYSVI